jgi:hypothetical protein
VPKNHILHGGVIDPIETDLCKDIRREVLGRKSIALEPTRRHEDEDTKGRVAKTETLWFGFG